MVIINEISLASIIVPVGSGAASAVIRTLKLSVVVKRELSQKANLFIYRSIQVPTLTYGRELWVATERMRLRIQADEMSFLRRLAALSLRDRVRRSTVRSGRLLDVSLWRCFGHTHPGGAMKQTEDMLET